MPVAHNSDPVQLGSFPSGQDYPLRAPHTAHDPLSDPSTNLSIPEQIRNPCVEIAVCARVSRKRMASCSAVVCFLLTLRELSVNRMVYRKYKLYNFIASRNITTCHCSENDQTLTIYRQIFSLCLMENVLLQ